jgi:hypothetical protein
MQDSGLRRKAQRTGREKGCWVYIPAERLQAAGFADGSPVPHYRVWGGRRGSLLVTLYREA